MQSIFGRVSWSWLCSAASQNFKAIIEARKETSWAKGV